MKRSRPVAIRIAIATGEIAIEIVIGAIIDTVVTVARNGQIGDVLAIANNNSSDNIHSWHLIHFIFPLQKQNKKSTQLFELFLT